MAAGMNGTTLLANTPVSALTSAAPLIYNFSSLSNDGTVRVTGVDANATWSFSTDSGSHWSAERSVGTTIFTLTEGSYGAGSIRVRQTDLAGNVSTFSKNDALITIDTTAPAPPTVTLSNDTGTSSADGITSNGLITVSQFERGWGS